MTDRVLVLFETPWDRRQLAASRALWQDRYEVSFAEPADADTPWAIDLVGYLAEEAARRRGTIAGVFSTSDYPGATMAAALATELGLPGPRPQAVLGAAHKYLSRIAQREVVPEAVPGFARLDPHDPATWSPPFGFPCFVKPVKGAFSILSRVVESEEDLGRFLRGPRAEWFETVFLAMFDQLVTHFGLDHDGRWFLAEELLEGVQVTVEGWRTREAGAILGIVDSTFAPGTRSFVSFDYPSALPAEVQGRMERIALAVAEHLGLDDTLFNVEMTWDEARDLIRIVEVNPRACGQFADLYAKVDGVGGYEALLALCTGRAPERGTRGGGPFAAAASFPLRVFRPSRVVAVPDPARVGAVQAALPGALAWLECAAGDLLLSEDTFEDGASHRYGVLNLGGDSRADLAVRRDEVVTELGLVVEPVPG